MSMLKLKIIGHVFTLPHVQDVLGTQRWSNNYYRLGLMLTFKQRYSANRGWGLWCYQFLVFCVFFPHSRGICPWKFRIVWYLLKQLAWYQANTLLEGKSLLKIVYSELLQFLLSTSYRVKKNESHREVNTNSMHTFYVVVL